MIEGIYLLMAFTCAEKLSRHLRNIVFLEASVDKKGAIGSIAMPSSAVLQVNLSSAKGCKVGMESLTSQILADTIHQSNEGREAVLISSSKLVIEELPGLCQILGYGSQELCIPTNIWSGFGLVCSVISAPCCKSRAMPLRSVSAIWSHHSRTDCYLFGPFAEQPNTVVYPRFLALF